MKVFSPKAIAALALAAGAGCSDAHNIVAPTSPLAPQGQPSPALVSGTFGDLTASVNAPDAEPAGALAPYTVSLSTTNTSTPPIEVVIVMDGSGSLLSSGWTLERAAVKDLILHGLPATAKVGIVVFSDASTIKYNFNLNQTRSTIAAVVDALPFENGSTATLAGMQDAVNVIRQTGTSTALHQVLLITDGAPNPSLTQNPCGTTTAAKALRQSLIDNNVQTTIYGVGPDITTGTLSCLINNDPSRFITVSDITTLDQTFSSSIAVLSGYQDVTYVANFPTSETAQAITTSSGTATAANGKITWTLRNLVNSTQTLSFQLKLPAGVCTSGPNLTNQTLSYRNSATETAVQSVTLADQSIQTTGCDATGPSITPHLTGTLGAHDWYTSDVSVHWNVADAESGISSSTGCADVTLSTNSTGTTYTCSATSGGGSSEQSVTVKRDAVAPTITPVINGTVGGNGWYTTDVAVGFDIVYGVSGAGTLNGCTPAPVTTDGEQTFTCTATSAAGLSATKTVAVKRDASKPVINANVAGTAGLNGWYTSDVAVTWTTTDDQSGVATTNGCTSASVTQDDAGTTFTCSATNGAGLSDTKSVTVRRDTTKPTLAISGNLGSYTVDQTIAINCNASDAGSGIATPCAGVSGSALSFDLGTTTRTVQATDNAGNVGTATVTFTVAVTPASLSVLIEQWASGDGQKKLLNRMKNIEDKYNKKNPSLDEQVKNFLKELDDAQRAGQVSAANAATLARLVSTLTI